MTKRAGMPCVQGETRMKIAIITGSILLALGGRASAQPQELMSEPPRAPASAPGEAPLSEDTAMLLSLGGTLVAWSTLLAAGGLAERHPETAAALGITGGIGALVAPSFGHWYARTPMTTGLGLRIGGGLAIALGLGMMLEGGILPASLEGEDPSAANMVIGLPLLLAGSAALVAGTIGDLSHTPRRVREVNRERAGVAIAPIVAPHSAGLALGGSF
jgi:hypothetical protein